MFLRILSIFSELIVSPSLTSENIKMVSLDTRSFPLTSIEFIISEKLHLLKLIKKKQNIEKINKFRKHSTYTLFDLIFKRTYLSNFVISNTFFGGIFFNLMNSFKFIILNIF